jgi:hypothetical protein
MTTLQASQRPSPPATAPSATAAPAAQPRKPWRAPTIEQIPFDQTLAGIPTIGGVDGGIYTSTPL